MRIIDGYDRIVEHLHRAIDPEHLSLRLRSIVTRIEWKKGEVKVLSQSPLGEPREPVQAKCAIITLPLGVLRAAPNDQGFVHFQPEIPQKHVAAHRLEMGRVVKIIVHSNPRSGRTRRSTRCAAARSWTRWRSFIRSEFRSQHGGAFSRCDGACWWAGRAARHRTRWLASRRHRFLQRRSNP